MVYVRLLSSICLDAVVGEVDVVEERCAAAHPASAHADHDDVVVCDFVLFSDDFKLTEQQVEGCACVGGFLLFANRHPVVGDLFVHAGFCQRLGEVKFLCFASFLLFVERLVPVLVKEVLASLSERFFLFVHNSVSFCCPSLCCRFENQAVGFRRRRDG